MQVVKNCFKVIVAIFVVLLSLTLLCANSPQLGLCGSLGVGLAAIAIAVKPFRPIWLGSRFVSVPVLFIAIIGMMVSLHVARLQGLELAAKDQQRLQQLRIADPKAYLAELKAAGDSRWEPELQQLDKRAYEEILVDRRTKQAAAEAERRAKEAAGRDVEMQKLIAELKSVPGSDISRSYTV